jgi:hypothetical protein
MFRSYDHLQTETLKIPDTHFCQRLSRPQSHTAAVRGTRIENSKYLIIDNQHSFDVMKFIYLLLHEAFDRLCSLVVRVLATFPEVQFRFPALSDFLRSSGSGMETT